MDTEFEPQHQVMLGKTNQTLDMRPASTRFWQYQRPVSPVFAGGETTQKSNQGDSCRVAH